MSDKHNVPIRANPDRVEQQRWEPQTSILLRDESDEDHRVVVKAVPPTRRDLWAILRGTYRPQVQRHRTFTARGMSKAIKKAWTSDEMRQQFYAENLLLKRLRQDPD